MQAPLRSVPQQLALLCREEDHRGGLVGSSQADAEHRLVAREKELRALAAEKDVLAQQGVVSPDPDF